MTEKPFHQPPLHMLEDLIMLWVTRWKLGCGCMGEQGVENLYMRFNNTEKTYQNTKDRVDRYYKTISPSSHPQQLLNPIIKKRKKKH